MAKYVGKRIVPLPCGEWVQTKEYEMLSVVLHAETGDSYMAKRQVPAGTAITDTAFWTKSSDYSQQLQNVSDELAETLRQVRADNDATEAAIRQSNSATAQTIQQDNENTRDHVDEVTATALASLAEGRQEMNTTRDALNTRMDSIVGGETTDTEVLDARVDSESTTHDNLGNHIRSVGAKLNVETAAFQQILDAAEGTEIEEIELESEGRAVIERNGAVTIAETLSESYRVSSFVDVQPGEIYSVTAAGHYNKHLYAFYDVDGNFISGLLETGTQIVWMTDKLVVVPVGAAKMRIAWLNAPNFTGRLGKVTHPIFPTGRLTGELLEDYDLAKAKVQAAFDHTVSEIGSGDYDFTEQAVEFEIISNKVLRASDGQPADLVRPSDNYKISEYIPVTPMELLHIVACSHYSNCIYVFYDENEAAISKVIAGEGAPVTIVDENVVVPLGAAYLRIAYLFATQVGSVGRLTRTGFKGTFTGSFIGNIVGDVTGDIYGNFLKWSGKKWATIGDSHTEHNIRATKNYHDYVAEKTGITVVNLGSSGSGYKRRWEDNKAFYQLLDRIPEDTDVVTFYGSGNDLATDLGEVTDTGTDTLCGCINTTIDRYNELFPGVPLGIVTPCPWASSNPSNPNNKMALYSDAIVEICRRRSIPCLDLYHCSNLRPWEAAFRELFYTRDDGGGCHPDENGHAILAPKFAAFLEQLIL
jgi:hypothetical protein